MTTRTTQDAYGLRYEPAKYRDLAMARQSVQHSVTPQRIMLGDDGRYWVVCPADANRLELAGIEYAD